jgi:hypothetical protein
MPVSTATPSSTASPTSAERTHASAPAIGRIPRPRGRDLSAPELEEFVAELADRPELWIELVRHDSGERLYEELLSEPHLTAWLICWMDEHDTGFHDHDLSAGAVAVVSGAVREERLAIEAAPRGRVFGAGSSFHFEASDIHRVSHSGDGPAVTLHVYSPPLLRMGAYEIGEGGVLARRTMSYRQELRAPAPGSPTGGNPG